MLDRLLGNAALKSDLAAALRADRLPHAVLLVGEAGCGAGFAARCLAADYLYPTGGPHAEAVLSGADSECIALRGEGKSGQYKVDTVRHAREAMQKSALSTDAAGRVLFLYGAQDMNSESANTLLKLIEEPPEGALFLFTATSAATVLPTIRSRCAAYTVAPVSRAECAAAICAALPRTPAEKAEELAFLYEGHIGLCLAAAKTGPFAAELESARALCAAAAAGDAYRAQVLLAAHAKEKESAQGAVRQLLYLASGALRHPGYAGLDAAAALRVADAAREFRQAMRANANLKIALSVLAIRCAGA